MSGRLPPQSNSGVKAVPTATAKLPARKATPPKAVSSGRTLATSSTTAQFSARKASPAKSGASTGASTSASIVAKISARKAGSLQTVLSGESTIAPSILAKAVLQKTSPAKSSTSTGSSARVSTAAKFSKQCAASGVSVTSAGALTQESLRQCTPPLPSKTAAKPRGAAPSNKAPVKAALKAGAVDQAKPSPHAAASTGISDVRPEPAGKSKATVGKLTTAGATTISTNALTNVQLSASKGACPEGIPPNTNRSPPVQKQLLSASMVGVALAESQSAPSQSEAASHLVPYMQQTIEAAPDLPQLPPGDQFVTSLERELLQTGDSPEATPALIPLVSEMSLTTRSNGTLRLGADMEALSAPSGDRLSVQFAVHDDVIRVPNAQVDDCFMSGDSTPHADDTEAICLYSPPRSADESSLEAASSNVKVSRKDASPPTSQERTIAEDLARACLPELEMTREADSGSLEPDTPVGSAPTPTAIGRFSQEILLGDKLNNNSRMLEKTITGDEASSRNASHVSDSHVIMPERRNFQKPHKEQRVMIEATHSSIETSARESDISASSLVIDSDPTTTQSTRRRVTLDIQKCDDLTPTSSESDRMSLTPYSNPQNKPPTRPSRRVTIEVHRSELVLTSPVSGRASLSPHSSSETKPPARPSRRVTIEVHHDELSPNSGRFSDASVKMSDASGSIALFKEPSERRDTVQIQSGGPADRASLSAAFYADQWPSGNSGRRATIGTAGTSGTTNSEDDDMEGRLDRLMQNTAQLLDQMEDASFDIDMGASDTMLRELVDTALLHEAFPWQRTQPSAWLDLSGIGPASPLAQRRALQNQKSAQGLGLLNGDRSEIPTWGEPWKPREPTMSESTKRHIRRSLMQPANFQQSQALESSVNAAFSQFDHDIRSINSFQSADEEVDTNSRTRASSSTSAGKLQIVERLRKRLTEAMNDLEGEYEFADHKVDNANADALLKAEEEIRALKKAKEESDRQQEYWRSKYETMFSQTTRQSSALHSTKTIVPSAEDDDVGVPSISLVAPSPTPLMSPSAPKRSLERTHESFATSHDSPRSDLGYGTPEPWTSAEKSHVSGADRTLEACSVKDWSGLRPLLRAWEEKHSGVVKGKTIKSKGTSSFAMNANTSLKQNLRNWTAQYEKMQKNMPQEKKTQKTHTHCALPQR